MRKLLLLISLVFTVYYGSSLWTFSDSASYAVIANYVPLVLLLLIFIIGLIHIRFGLAVSTVLVLLFGNPALLNHIVINVLGAPESFAAVARTGSLIESVILGLFSAWCLVRFFGNPDLDYELNRARTVRAIHFPVFLFAFTAVIGALYAVIQTNNIFFSLFWDQVKNSLTDYPFPFLKGAAPLFPIRMVIYLLESIAVYVIVINEVRSARQVRFFMWLLAVSGVGITLLGLLQFTQGWDAAYTERLWQINKEVQSSFSDPNSLAVFLLAVIPACVALMYRNIITAIIGFIMCVIVLVGILLTSTKLAILAAGVFLVIALIAALVRMAKTKEYVPAVLLALLIVIPLGLYGFSLSKANQDNPPTFAKFINKNVNETAGAFFSGNYDLKSLNARTNYKLSDWLTAVNMVKPTSNAGGANLLCGVGYTNFKNKYSQYVSRQLASTRGRKGASNMFLQTLAETGIFGALALLLVTLGAIVYALRAAEDLEHPAYIKGIAFMLLMLTVGCMSENSFMMPQIQFVFWMLAGLCMVSASLAAREGVIKGSSLINGLLLVLIIIGSAWVFYPILTSQNNRNKEIKQIALDGSDRYQLTYDDLLDSLQQYGNYNFTRNRWGLWSMDNSLVMTRMTNPVFSTTLFCVNPKCSPDNPITATISIDGITLTKTVFSSKQPEEKIAEADITKLSGLTQYLDNGSYVLVHINVDKTFVPAEEYPAASNDTFKVGVNVRPVVWRSELSPVPPPRSTPPVTPADVVKDVTGAVSNAVDAATEAVNSAVGTAADAVKTSTDSATDKMKSLTDTLKSAVDSSAENAQDAVNDAAGTAKDAPAPKAEVETPFGTIKEPGVPNNEIEAPAGQ